MGREGARGGSVCSPAALAAVGEEGFLRRTSPSGRKEEKYVRTYVFIIHVHIEFCTVYGGLFLTICRGLFGGWGSI